MEKYLVSMVGSDSRQPFELGMYTANIDLLKYRLTYLMRQCGYNRALICDPATNVVLKKIPSRIHQRRSTMEGYKSTKVEKIFTDDDFEIDYRAYAYKIKRHFKENPDSIAKVTLVESEVELCERHLKDVLGSDFSRIIVNPVHVEIH